MSVGYSAIMHSWSNHLVEGMSAMTITIEADPDENGVLRPTRPLPLKDQELVRITIEPEPSWSERTAGLLQWKGDAECLEHIAEGDDFSILDG